MSPSSLTSLERARLSCRTAEMLALPEMVCDKRMCRRSHRCEFFDSKSGARWCLQFLRPEERAAWDELHAIVIGIAGQVHARAPSPDPRIRELEEAAIEIVRAVPLHDPLRHLFKTWLEAYRSNGSDGPPGQLAGRDTSPPHAPEEPATGASEWMCDIAYANADDPRLDWRTYR